MTSKRLYLGCEGLDCPHEIVGYNQETGAAKIKGENVEYTIALTPAILAVADWQITREDGSHAQWEELQTRFEA